VNEGLYALLGVVVGAVAPGLPTWMLARRAEKRERRVASRLVREEIVNAGPMLESAMKNGWFVEFALPLEGWKQHAATLASELPETTWDKVAQAMGTLQKANLMLMSMAENSGGHISAKRIPQDGKDVVAAAISELKEARDALDPLV
jgi:hypothetical protein